MNGVNEFVGVLVKEAVEVAVVVKVEVGVEVAFNGVKLKVAEGGVRVKLGVMVSDAVAVGVAGPGLIITATHPRQ